MIRPHILVTGATGNVGAEVVGQLRAKGHPVRIGVSDTQRSEGHSDPGISPVQLDFMNPATWQPALESIKKVFLVRPPAISDVKSHINPFIDVAKDLSVEHVVLLSLLGAEKITVVPHRGIELHLERSGMPNTFLRASFLMQNLSTTHLKEIRDTSEIAVPAGRGKTSFVDVRAVAAVAVTSLLDEGHEHCAYPLTGSEALNYAEVARILTETLDRPIHYVRPSLLAFARSMRRQGNPSGFILVTAAIYTTARLGMADSVTSDLGRLLGRSPTTMRQFVTDHANLWSVERNA